MREALVFANQNNWEVEIRHDGVYVFTLRKEDHKTQVWDCSKIHYPNTWQTIYRTMDYPLDDTVPQIGWGMRDYTEIGNYDKRYEILLRALKTETFLSKQNHLA